MNYLVSTSAVKPSSTVVALPLSKSLSNRLLVIRALAGCTTSRDAVAACDDTDVMLRALGNPDAELVDIGAAGTAMRFLTAYYASRPGCRVTIDGSDRMRRRPIGPLVDALRECGASIRYIGEEGFPPLAIEGRELDGGAVEIDASVSSQYISAVLMIGPTMNCGLRLSLRGERVSQPYIDMTVQLMVEHGAQVEVTGNEITVMPGRYHALHDALAVEPDWSAASYWYEICALTGISCVLPGLKRLSLQGDSIIRDYFTRLGVETRYEDHGVTIGHTLQVENDSLKISLQRCPDVAQTLAATCCGLGKPFELSGLSTLPRKETDRLSALCNELGKLGYDVRQRGGDTLSWNGARKDSQEPVVIETYKDHRMAMALAPLATVNGPIIIADAGVVSKSYPEYWQHLMGAGFSVKEV